MLTRLKILRGEVQIVNPGSYPTRRKQFRSPQIAERHSPSMAHAESHGRVPDEEEDLRQTIIQLRDMMKVMMGHMMSQGEGCNPSMHNEGGGNKNPGGNGGNGSSPPPSPPPSSSSSSSSSTSSKNLPHSPKGHGKTPSQIPSLKLDIKFELPIYNGEVNAEKLDKWIRKIEVYSKIQKIQDDEKKI
jgi:hypothetical protein